MNSLAQPGKWERYFWPFLAASVFLAVWFVSVKWTASKVFPSPMDVQRGMAELVRKGVLWHYMLVQVEHFADERQVPALSKHE